MCMKIISLIMLPLNGVAQENFMCILQFCFCVHYIEHENLLEKDIIKVIDSFIMFSAL